jgi:hypothetical protein
LRLGGSHPACPSFNEMKNTLSAKSFGIGDSVSPANKGKMVPIESAK